jgi:hypothetical protein
MKRAGELLSAFLDEGILKKAKGYHDLFSTWKDIAGDQIGAHSRIVELERSVLLIEADHPGWIQILQMKQRLLLNAVRRRFPELSIAGISFRLSRDPERDFQQEHVQLEERTQTGEQKPEPEDAPLRDDPADKGSKQNLYGNISSPEFKETLMRLEKSIHG